MASETHNTDLRLKEIALKIKDLRKKSGWKSYETFALDHHLDRKQYWRVENGSNITLATLLKILDIHQVSLKEFFNELDL
ncbi:MAG: helix-turn-helix domain-containing protein [Runella sp.]